MKPEWQVRWVLGKEVFTSPEGVEYVRATPETAELVMPARTGGVRSLYLKLGSAEGIRKRAARKARRLEKRTRRASQ